MPHNAEYADTPNKPQSVLQGTMSESEGRADRAGERPAPSPTADLERLIEATQVTAPHNADSVGRWASFPRKEHPDGEYAHLVKKGGVTSLCGTTALPASMWRSDNRKPQCPRCLSHNGSTGAPPEV